MEWKEICKEEFLVIAEVVVEDTKGVIEMKMRRIGIGR